MQAIRSVTYTESRRAELRALVKLTDDIIPPLWPLRTAISIDPLVGLEELEFHDAIQRAQAWWDGRGYLPNERYRAYDREGRITRQQIDAELIRLLCVSTALEGWGTMPPASDKAPACVVT